MWRARDGWRRVRSRRASPTVCPCTRTSLSSPVKRRSGVGIWMVTLNLCLLAGGVGRLGGARGVGGARGGGAVGLVDPLLVEALAVVREAPTPRVGHPPALDRDDQVGEPRPGVLAVEVARPRRMIGVGMVVADDVEPRGARLALRGEDGLGG